MPFPVQVAWLTGTEALNRELAAKLSALHPDLTLVTVSEFPVDRAQWVPYHPKRRFAENFRTIRNALRDLEVRQAAVIVVPRLPLWPLRIIAFALAGRRLTVYNSGLAARPLATQAVDFFRLWLAWHRRPEAPLPRWLARVRHPRQALVPLYAQLAYGSVHLRRSESQVNVPAQQNHLKSGTTVLIPSRSGLHLLRECLPLIAAQHAAQIVVIDNGSDDGTAAALRSEWPSVQVLETAHPLSFAGAINLGLNVVEHQRVLLLNNDMLVEPQFLAALESAFTLVPSLFCATAQILFPPGARREETGKAVMHEPATETDFPIRCDVPLEGEDGTWVLYGSGGCSLFDTAKLRALGGLNESLTPAYVEDLDLGFRAWQRGWPSVFRAAARVEHRHRSTTGRYWTAEQIDTMVQVNYLRFLASAIYSKPLLLKLWRQAIRRLHLHAARAALRLAVTIPFRHHGPAPPVADEQSTLALTCGDVALFPGRAVTGKPVILVAAPYLPFPLSHGGAVRIYNLMREGLRGFDWVLIAFTETWEPPPPKLLALCVEITLVKRTGSHYKVSTDRPDTVEEFASPVFRAALRQTVSKWQPPVVQLEWTQMAQYTADCVPARTVLVEHDITFDLYEQMSSRSPDDREVATQLGRWRSFETAAWRQVDAVVAMSDKDRQRIGRAHARTVPNGVDTEQYQPSAEPVEENTLLFIGSFVHHPNRLAIEWFLREVWPLLDDLNPNLHVIAGAGKHQLEAPRITVEGFVSDVRPAYRRAAAVIAPLIASAGTNIKILEAMAMGKAIVSTSAGINGLDVDGVQVADSPEAFASAIRSFLLSDDLRRQSGTVARSCAAARYSWRSIAGLQTTLYQQLIGAPQLHVNRPHGTSSLPADRLPRD